MKRPPLEYERDMLFYLTDLAGFLVSPARLQGQGIIEADSAGSGAIGSAAAAVPALFGVKNDGGLTLLGMGDINVDLTYVDAGVAADALFGVDQNRHARSLYIGNCKYFICHCSFLLS